MDNRGISIKYTNSKMKDMLAEYAGGSGAEEMFNFLFWEDRVPTFDWVTVTSTGLGNGKKTPAQIISMFFDGSYKHTGDTGTTDQGGAFGTISYGTADAQRLSGLMDYGSVSATRDINFGAGDHLSVTRNMIASIFLSNLSTAYTVRATLAYLPSTTLESDTKLYGFMDWQDKFKMTYDFDVFAFLQMPTPTGMLNLFQEGDVDGAIANIDADDWRDVTGDSSTPEYSYWPPYDNTLDIGDQNGAWKRSQMTPPYDSHTTQYHSTTFTIDAVGIDFMDALLGEPDELSDSTFEEIQDLCDPNYFLHSNQIYAENAVGRSQWAYRVESPYFTDEGATYVSPLVDLSTNGRLVKLYKCRFTSKHSTQGFLSYDNSEVYNGKYVGTKYDGVPSTSIWEPWYSRYGTHSWEKACFVKATDMMCDDIQALIDVEEYPKKLLNKVQKRGKLRDEQISAFGYTAVDEEAYKLYLSQGGSAQPVTIDYTGESIKMDARELSEDARTGPNEEGTYWGAEGDLTWEEYIAEESS